MVGAYLQLGNIKSMYIMDHGPLFVHFFNFRGYMSKRKVLNTLIEIFWRIPTSLLNISRIS